MTERTAPARVPAPALFVAAGVFQYTGAAFAVGLFAVLSPAGTTWWRIAVGALALLAVWRPWRQQWTRKEVLASMIFGLALGLMNLLFYEALARLPMGTAVSIEFLGPVAVAAVRGRGWGPRAAAGLALVGVVLIGGWGLDLGADGVALGAVFALGAAAMWSVYIVLGQRIAHERSGVNSLAVGTLAAAVLFAPFLVPETFSVTFTLPLVLAILAMGILSTAVPYSLEAIALGRLSSAVFAILTALLPATATIIGAAALHQIPTIGEALGLAAISVAVWLATKGQPTG